MTTTQTSQAQIAEAIPANSQPSIADHHANVVRLAEDYHYQGELTVGALEDRIRFYQGRTVEAVLEMGKCLLILKEMCPHGDFAKRIELLGFSPRMAQKFMQVTLKVKSEFNSLIAKVDSQTKLLELITLDDDQLEALNSGESVGGITLDDIDTMSVSELKKALKQAHAENDAKDEVLATKNRKIDELDAKLSVRKQIDNAKVVQQEVESHINDELGVSTKTVMTAVSQFGAVIETLSEQAQENYLPHLNQKIVQEVSFLYSRLAELGLSLGVDLSAMMASDWATDLGDSE
ncbi:MAG: DUF3102 domain-containing protein [Moraxella sp.]|nr:DUF3102 domain-containing protein [Moraxella sp.]